ncbi:transcription-silencing protein Clr2-domain-containing protein [Cladorrhinum samala]|uniref:Transcription-silencing protein Clr2-domain-containing protein n=1 Tax=Cladorrhinum samala TaxID=585594 RepID=A0AAV9HD31_9PEZI|nr:transcription-silencing protein Clr2-domain-containing protein [Cladorrhinum samala]
MASSAPQADEYWPMYIARSDGQGYQNLDQLPLDLKDENDVAQLERWEVIVGGHLQIQLAPKDDKKLYKLASLPHGYDLRVAIRKDAARDYYLYGHPAGAKAIFRTPGDFALHVLWLVSGSEDQSDCSCELCARYVETMQHRFSNAVAVQNAVPVNRPVPPQQQHQQQIQQNQQQLQPHPTASPAPAVRNPPGTSGVTNVFRVGEMVWYKHAAWRLGIILAITPRIAGNIPPGAGDSSFNFHIAPLGHARLKQDPLVKDAMSMRPFLTFSVPATSFDELKDIPFEEVNWAEYVASHSTEPNPAQRNTMMQSLGLEASKLGARSTNDSYSFFNKIYDDLTHDKLYRMQCFLGVYLGAEMILVHDPIRVAPTAEQAADPNMSATDITLVMRVAEITVLTPRTQPNARPVLQFRGNTYRTVRSPVNSPPPNVIQQAETIGPAFAEELAARNSVEKDKSMRWWWVLVENNAVRQENDVTGRYYTTEKLMTIIDPARYESWVANGVLEDPPAYLNTRGQSGNGTGYTGRKPGRAAALGEAISVPFKVPDLIVEDIE